jgi:hypothetical protein
LLGLQQSFAVVQDEPRALQQTLVVPPVTAMHEPPPPDLLLQQSAVRVQGMELLL